MTGDVSQGTALVGHTTLAGHGDCGQVIVRDGFAYVGHMGTSRVGTSIVDVTDPRQPRLVAQIMTPPGTHSHKVQLVDDYLLVNHERNPNEPRASSWSAGLKIFDVSQPARPVEAGFLPMRGMGVHRATWRDGPRAYVSGSDEGYTDQFFMVIDLSNPTRPAEVSRWWLPGMHTGGGEEPSWEPRRRHALHHPIIRDSRAYCAWWDAGLVILDIEDEYQPRLVAHLEFGVDVSGCTHTVLPVPGKDLLVVSDEAVSESDDEIPKRVRVVDISDETCPRVCSTFPVPDRADGPKVGRFGPHNLHEMRPGSFVHDARIHVSYFGGGVRIVDISNPMSPREVGAYVPPTVPGQAVVQINDLFVTADGLMYLTDRLQGGLYVARDGAGP